MMQTIKAASVPEKYILRRYTKRPNIQPTFNRNDLRTVASNKASQYCIESSLLTLNMRVHRKSLRSQEQMARSRVVMTNLKKNSTPCILLKMEVSRTMKPLSRILLQCYPR